MSLAKHLSIRWQVTGPALFILLVLLCTSLIAGESAASFFSDLQGAIVAQAGSFYIFSLTALLVLAIGLALSPAGKLRLGRADAQPTFSSLSWFSMLFSAGMGIGLLFYGVAEPVYHLESPPYETDKLLPEAVAMRVTFFFIGAYIHGHSTPWLVSHSAL